VLTHAAHAALAGGLRRRGASDGAAATRCAVGVRGAGSGVVVSARLLHPRGILRWLPAAGLRRSAAAAATRERGVTPNDE